MHDILSQTIVKNHSIFFRCIYAWNYQLSEVFYFNPAFSSKALYFNILFFLWQAQFVGVIIYAISLWYNQCNISKIFIIMNFVHAALFLGLFLNFFVQNYIRKQISHKKSPVLVIPRENKRPVINEITNGVSSESKKTHAKQLMKQKDKESDFHLSHLNFCAKEMCSHLRCRNFQNGFISGRHCNWRIAGSMHI